MDVNANLKHTLPIKQILIKRKMYLCVCLKFLLFLILSGNADLEKQKIFWLVSLHRAAVVCDSPEASPDLISLKSVKRKEEEVFSPLRSHCCRNTSRSPDWTLREAPAPLFCRAGMSKRPGHRPACEDCLDEESSPGTVAILSLCLDYPPKVVEL